MLEKLSTREKNLLLVLVGLLLGVAIYYGPVRYQIPKYRETRQQIAIHKREIQSVISKLQQLSKLEAKNGELKQELDVVKKPFETDIRNGTNYFFIGKHAVNNAVRITKTAPLSVQVKKLYLEMPLNIQVRGQYNKILQFVKLVEQDMPNTSELRHLAMKCAGAQVSSPESKDAAASTAPVGLVMGSNPDVEAELKIITYLSQSPKAARLAQEWPLGRFDVFSPTVDVPGPINEKGETGIIPATPDNSTPKDGDTGAGQPVFATQIPTAGTAPVMTAKEPVVNGTVPVAKSPARPAAEEEKAKTAVDSGSPGAFPVKKAIVKSTGKYRFPSRNGLDKGGIK